MISAINELSTQLRIAMIDPASVTINLPEDAFDKLVIEFDKKMPGFASDSQRHTGGWKRLKYDGITFAALEPK